MGTYAKPGRWEQVCDDGTGTVRAASGRGDSEFNDMVYRDNTCDMESHILASGHTEKRQVYTCNCIKEIHFASLLKKLLVLQKKKNHYFIQW